MSCKLRCINNYDYLLTEKKNILDQCELEKSKKKKKEIWDAIQNFVYLNI